MGFRKRSKSEFEIYINYSETQNCPCIRRSCSGFMFKILVQYEPHGDIMEEWECFTCRKIKRIGVYSKGQQPQLKGRPNGKRSRQLSHKDRQDQRKGKRRDYKQDKSNGSNRPPRKVSRPKGSTSSGPKGVPGKDRN